LRYKSDAFGEDSHLSTRLHRPSSVLSINELPNCSENLDRSLHSREFATHTEVVHPAGAVRQLLLDQMLNDQEIE
jgi:hypothetical protein